MISSIGAAVASAVRCGLSRTTGARRSVVLASSSRFANIRSDVSFKHQYYHSSSANLSSPLQGPTNGKYLDYSMLYHDSVAFLLSNQLGIPPFIGSDTKTPTQVAKEFNLSIRAASALLVTLCRMDVVQVHTDSNESVDYIVYELTPSASEYSMYEDCCLRAWFANVISLHNHIIVSHTLN